jgi:hypothetical protein
MPTAPLQTSDGRRRLGPRLEFALAPKLGSSLDASIDVMVPSISAT